MMISEIENILGQKMLDLLEEDGNYKNVELDLYTFAKLLGVSPRTLSGLVQENFGVGFREFLNQFRIQKVQDLILVNKNNWMVQEYALAVGYRSRITFFNTFKSHIGVSPDEFIKSVSVSKQ